MNKDNAGTLIAELAHEVNRAYCEGIGDMSQPSWVDAPEWQKKSAMNGVAFHLQNNASPEDTWKNWKKQKVNEGWVYGEVKCPKKKTHPCIVEKYNQLPLEQQIKDRLFGAVVGVFKRM